MLRDFLLLLTYSIYLLQIRDEYFWYSDGNLAVQDII